MSGGLNNTNADALAQAIFDVLDATGSVGLDQWKSICQTFYEKLLVDIVIMIQTGAIVTTGSATTQTGPAAPILINPNP